MTLEPLAKIRAFCGFRLADSLPSKVMEGLRSAGFQPARGKSNEAGWKPALRIKIALGEFRGLQEALLKSFQWRKNHASKIRIYRKHAGNPEKIAVLVGRHGDDLRQAS
jgi:hypothetical protein